MSDDYLWTGEGTPDPFVEELERKLACKRYRVQPLKTELRDVRSRRRPTTTGRVRYLPLVAGAAAAIVLALVGWSMQEDPGSKSASPTVRKPSINAPIPVAKPGLGPTDATADEEKEREKRTKRGEGRHVISDQ